MSEAKKRTITLELADEDAKAFFERCFRDGTTPPEVLKCFINDLVDGSQAGGSDERELANKYYDRCGYGYFFPDERRTFTQWLLNDYYFETVAGAMEDIKTFEEEIAYLKKHPEDTNEGEIEDLEREIADSKEEIEFIFREYEKSTSKPESLEEGLKGVREYQKTVEGILKGGTL